ncbi:MAG: hypothetical protein KKC75_02620 [Nanoarchaeota archaeon]|nr:hypothetical protein [Nanoarchaeota archaeon]
MTSDKGKRVVIVIVVFTVLEIILAFFSKYSIFRIIPGMSIIGGGGAVVAIIVVFGLISHANSKGDKFGKNTAQYLVSPFAKLANTLESPLLGWLFKKLDIHETTPGGGTDKEEFSFAIRRIWTEMYTLMNYLLRLQIYLTKLVSVNKKYELIRKEVEEADLKKNTAFGLDASMDMWKNGAPYKKEGNGFVVDERKVYSIDDWGKLKEATINTVGGNSYEFYIFRFFENLRDELENAIKSNDIIDQEDQEFEAKKRNLRTKLTEEYTAMKDSRARYLAYRKRRGVYNKYICYRNLVLDVYNKNGKYKHTFKFARPGVKTKKYKITLDRTKDPPFGEIISKVDQGNGADVDKLTEVSRDGFFLDELNDLRLSDDGVLTGVVRKVEPGYDEHVYLSKKKDKINMVMPRIIDYPLFAQVLRWMSQEWLFAIRDFRDGRFHPYSKTLADYMEKHSMRKYNYKDIVSPTHGKPNKDNPMFDREALKDIGRFVYRGRKRYDDINEERMNENPENKFPGVSTIGLSAYIENFIDQFADEFGKEQKRRFVFDVGSEENMFTNMPEKKNG